MSTCRRGAMTPDPGGRYVKILGGPMRKKAALALVALVTMGTATVVAQAPASAAPRYVAKGSQTLHHRSPDNTRKIVVRTRVVHDTKKDLWRAEVRVRCYWRTKVLADWGRASCRFDQIGLVLYSKKGKTSKEIAHHHFTRLDDYDGVVTKVSKWKKVANNLQVRASTHADVVRIVDKSFCWQNGQCPTFGRWVSAK